MRKPARISPECIDFLLFFRMFCQIAETLFFPSSFSKLYNSSLRSQLLVLFIHHTVLIEFCHQQLLLFSQSHVVLRVCSKKDFSRTSFLTVVDYSVSVSGSLGHWSILTQGCCLQDLAHPLWNQHLNSLRRGSGSMSLSECDRISPLSLQAGL